ncbi:MAG TPA: hypothetical protein VHC92_07085 [Rhodanobacteraceae bacterium]|nr:hypothetical protein [Rhodanobacteraceae bacterium]
MAKKSIPVQAERSEHAKSLWFNMTRDKHRQLSQEEQVELKAHGKYTDNRIEQIAMSLMAVATITSVAEYSAIGAHEWVGLCELLKVLSEDITDARETAYAANDALQMHFERAAAETAA